MIAEDIDNIKIDNLIISEPLKNSIIQSSNFYKINYSNEFITLNGLFFKFPLNKVKIDKDFIIFENSEFNNNQLKKLEKLENNLLNLINNINKKKNYKIIEIFKTNIVRFIYNDNYKNNEHLNSGDLSDENNEIIKNTIKTFNNKDNDNYNHYNDYHNDSKLQNIILKISGIWETKDNIGLTFKILLYKYEIVFYPSVEK